MIARPLYRRKNQHNTDPQRVFLCLAHTGNPVIKWEITPQTVNIPVSPYLTDAQLTELVTNPDLLTTLDTLRQHWDIATDGQPTTDDAHTHVDALWVIAAPYRYPLDPVTVYTAHDFIDELLAWNQCSLADLAALTLETVPESVYIVDSEALPDAIAKRTRPEEDVMTATAAAAAEADAWEAAQTAIAAREAATRAAAWAAEARAAAETRASLREAKAAWEAATRAAAETRAAEEAS